MTNARQQRGATLLEALVAVLIFSLGVLGLVGLLGAATQQSSDAQYRAVAAELADQLLGDMWIADRSTTNLQTQFGTCASASVCPGYATWAQAVATRLPGVTADGASQPTVAVANDGTVSIVLVWQPPGTAAPPASAASGSSSAAHRYQLVARVLP